MLQFCQLISISYLGCFRVVHSIFACVYTNKHLCLLTHKKNKNIETDRHNTFSAFEFMILLMHTYFWTCMPISIKINRSIYTYRHNILYFCAFSMLEEKTQHISGNWLFIMWFHGVLALLYFHMIIKSKLKCEFFILLLYSN